MENLIPIWIDTDCGVDDAYALLTALKLPNLDIKGVSAVCGNVEVSKTFINARNILSLAKREDIKVYRGAEQPFEVPLSCAYDVHGVDGLGGVEVEYSEAPLETENAIDALYNCAKACNGELHIVSIGPLTNIATAILKYPDFLDYVKEIDMMGGSIFYGGNCTTTAEFNIYCDPHGAQTVFKSGVKIVMFGLDVTTKAILTREEIESIQDIDNPVRSFLYESSSKPMEAYQVFGLGDVMCLHDTCPFVYLAYPDVFKGKEAGVYVETRSKISFGRTVSDLYTRSDDLFEDNSLVMLEVDRDRFAKIVLDSFNAY